MFHIIIQTLCQIIVAIAAIKYLMPDIRKLCRKIAESEETKENKKKPEKVQIEEIEQKETSCAEDGKSDNSKETDGRNNSEEESKEVIPDWPTDLE